MSFFGVERLAFLYADGLHVETFDRREDFSRLIVDELGQHLEEHDSVGVDRVDGFARAVEELHLRRARRFRQRVDLDLLHERHGLVGLPVDLKAANPEADDVGRRLDDEVALRHVACVSRRKERYLPPLPLSGPGRPMSTR